MDHSLKISRATSPLALGFGVVPSLIAPAADETIRVDLLRLTAHLDLSSPLYLG
jgi:hypothetical protein